VNDFHGDYKQQLVTAAEALFPARAATPRRSAGRKIGRPRHVPLLAALTLAALLLAAAALAATQIIGFGVPVRARRAPGRERPSASTGVGIPVVGAKSTPAAAQLLAISVPDPAGGLPWGMRIVHTTRGLVCVQIGRLLDGRLGVLGQDGEFNDDGLFHELPVAVLDPDMCFQPTDRVLLSDAGLPAAGELQSPATSCLPSQVPRTRPSEPRHCPAGDERLVAFGMLGPHAVSVSYRAYGQLPTVDTVATAGSHGAYLIVLRSPPDPSRNVPVLGGTSAPLDSFPIGTGGSSTVVTRLVFRFGGHLCQTGLEHQPGALPLCTKSIARTDVPVPEIPHGLRTPVALKARRVPGGYDLDVTFTAPAAVENASTAYGVQVATPSDRACGIGGVWGQSVERDVARGEALRATVFVGQRPGCHGVAQGRVILGAEPLPDAFSGTLRSAEMIGRFSFVLP
jgi:hypothetical protein